MKKFDNEKYQILAKDLMGDIFYSETSNRNKIATIRQYAEVIVRKILDINPSKKMTIGANEISKKLDALNNSEFLKEALENIRQDGNKFTHTEYLEEVTSDEFDKIVDKLLDMLSFMLINYFETYEFGSRSDVLQSFSLLPPIVRYKVLIFLYSKYPNNIHVIDRLALAIVKAFDKEEAIRWIEAENNLINLDVMSDKAFNEIAENKGIEFAKLIRFNSPYKNMYELCIDKIMKIGNEIDSKGHLYIDFESALPYYKQYGIIDEDSEEIKEFNDIMDFLYLGRRTKLDSFIKLKEPYVTLNVITGDNNIDESI
ncbi:hypothetical protein HMPREF9966_1046 [Streptococcus anginosus SK52 = DSM 20563]|uniref:hypothetical protein n=1 Tax=Streptococcus anginosus TaxID=1328 RepID=UPI00020DEBFA|nr:hypothetical protein [Streptococcus anginosus]EGL43742.1 hypothetical protein HMPREF9966_1046 [Streptococcus anginosus SK52 = DSM 20563]